jgi:hypothetical protein
MTTFEFTTRIEITEPSEIEPELQARMAALVTRAIDREIERAFFGGPPPQPQGTVTIETVRPTPLVRHHGVFNPDWIAT